MHYVRDILALVFGALAEWTKGIFPRLEFLLPSLFGLILLYLILWQSSQGLDLIAEMSRNYFQLSVLVYWVAIGGYSLSLWYIPKELLQRPSRWQIWSNAVYDEEARTVYTPGAVSGQRIYHEELLRTPRLIMALNILVGGIVFVKYFWTIYPVDQNDFYTAPFILFFLAFIFILGCNRYTDWVESNFKYHKNRFLSIVGSTLAIGVLLPYIIQETLGQGDFYVWTLVLSNIVIALSLWAFLIVRTQLYIGKGGQVSSYFTYFKLKYIFWAFFALLGIVYIMCIFNPVGIQYVPFYEPSALVVMLMCFIVLVLSATYYFLLKSSLVGIVLSIAVIAGIKGVTPKRNPYVLSKIASVGEEPRQSYDAYIKSWLQERDTGNGEPIPLYMVLCEGGGIRSSYWTSYVLSRMRDTLGMEFNRGTLAIVGASGGAVGGAIYTALQYEGGSGSSPMRYANRVDKFFGHNDFLIPSLGALVTRDWGYSVLSHFIPFKTERDRGRILEETFEQAMERQLGSRCLHRGVKTMVEKGYPLFIPHATHVQSGRRAVFSPVVLPESWEDRDLDVMDHSFFDSTPAGDLRIITAAVASARFPYIGAGAELKPGYQLVDAGYIDNFGAGTAITLLRRAYEIADNMGVQIRPGIILLHSGQGTRAMHYEEVRDLDVPPVTLAKIQGNLTARALYGLDHFIQQTFPSAETYSFNLLRRSKHGDNKKVYHFPLGWYISDHAMEGMGRNLEADFNPDNYQQFMRVLQSFVHKR